MLNIYLVLIPQRLSATGIKSSPFGTMEEDLSSLTLFFLIHLTKSRVECEMSGNFICERARVSAGMRQR